MLPIMHPLVYMVSFAHGYSPSIAPMLISFRSRVNPPFLCLPFGISTVTIFIFCSRQIAHCLSDIYDMPPNDRRVGKLDSWVGLNTFYKTSFQYSVHFFSFANGTSHQNSVISNTNTHAYGCGPKVSRDINSLAYALAYIVTDQITSYVQICTYVECPFV